MMENCFITGLACKGVACEGIYHEATQQCKIVMMVNRYLGRIDGPAKTETPSPKSDSPLVADAMKSDNPFPELKIGGFLPTITGRISSPIEVREVTAQGKPTDIAEFGLTDGVAVVKVTVWEPEADLLTASVGSKITLTKMSVREYKGETQISTTRASTISR